MMQGNGTSKWKDSKASNGKRWNLVETEDVVMAQGNVEIHSMFGMVVENPNRDISPESGHWCL